MEPEPEPEPEPGSLTNPSNHIEKALRPSSEIESEDLESEEEAFRLKDPSTALLGLVIAVATVGIPLFAVITERKPEKGSVVPTAQLSYGSDKSISMSFRRPG
tara:strand:- start:524 stop:832 length:309 start_codon:yes stop_codon:yes gene_type:complete